MAMNSGVQCGDEIGTMSAGGFPKDHYSPKC